MAAHPLASFFSLFGGGGHHATFGAPSFVDQFWAAALDPQGGQHATSRGATAAELASLPRFCVPSPTDKCGDAQEELDSCVVCQDELEGGAVGIEMPCAHRFHEACLLPWLQTNTTCPTCRCQVSAAPVTKAKKTLSIASEPAVVSSNQATRSAAASHECALQPLRGGCPCALNHSTPDMRTRMPECGHTFHTECLQEYQNIALPAGRERGQAMCPVCRRVQLAPIADADAPAHSTHEPAHSAASPPSKSKSVASANASAPASGSTWFVADCPMGDGGVQGAASQESAMIVDEDGDRAHEFVIASQRP